MKKKRAFVNLFLGRERPDTRGVTVKTAREPAIFRGLPSFHHTGRELRHVNFMVVDISPPGCRQNRLIARNS